MAKSSPERRDATRRRLLDATHRCLARNGFRSATTREILAEAELSPGTLYNHFDSKEDLYLTVARELLRDDIERLDLAARSDDVRDAVTQFLFHALLTVRPTATALADFRSHADTPEAVDALRSFNQWLVAQFGSPVAAAQERGPLRSDIDGDALVELLDIIWDGLGRRTGQGSFATSAERIASVVTAVMKDGAFTDRTEPAG
ncbi:MAG: TetR/AcrR family transcriptional regulator [Acidimicrobiia bacterium]|nr:TetR/AcrR family transcriptional regulator [Acidimicrobiia bacterium]